MNVIVRLESEPVNYDATVHVFSYYDTGAISLHLKVEATWNDSYFSGNLHHILKLFCLLSILKTTQQSLLK